MAAPELRVFVMTFNLPGKRAQPEDFSFIPKGFDLYALGFQEVGPFVPMIAGRASGP